MKEIKQERKANKNAFNHIKYADEVKSNKAGFTIGLKCTTPQLEKELSKGQERIERQLTLAMKRIAQFQDYKLRRSNNRVESTKATVSGGVE